MADKMNIELDTVLANELKDARTHKQLSQDEIANLVGIQTEVSKNRKLYDEFCG